MSTRRLQAQEMKANLFHCGESFISAILLANTCRTHPTFSGDLEKISQGLPKTIQRQAKHMNKLITSTFKRPETSEEMT
jgi:hypothetical protein